MTERPVLVTGAKGMLATALRARLAGDDGPSGGVLWTDVAELDITDAGAVRDFVERERPGVVINCAGLTDVDACERHRDAAMRVNAEAVGHLAGAAAGVDALLVHISTDFVFGGGRRGEPLAEDAEPAPLNVYGESKLAGEVAAREAPRHLVVRTAWLYGPGGRNFVRAISERASGGATLRVVDDQVGSPTYTRDLAEALWRLVKTGATGTVHACGSKAGSWYDFAVAIAAEVNPAAKVERIKSADLDRPAKRPPYSVMDCGRLRELVGYQLPGYPESLPKYLAELRAETGGK